MRDISQALILFLGIALVVFGVALWSVPAAMVVAGLVLVAAAYAWRYLTVMIGTADATS